MSSLGVPPPAGGVHDASETGLCADEVDFVVIGSGAGGGAATRTLAEAGHQVLVLEEGPIPDLAKLTPVLRDSMTQLYRAQGRFAAFGRSAVPMLQGRCVGGTTFVNSAIIWRLPDKVLQRWHDQHGLGDGLSAAAMDRAYTTLERDMLVRPVGEEIARRHSLLMREGAEKLGIAGRLLHRSEIGCHGSGRCLMGCPHGAKQSTTVNYLRRATEHGAHIYANAEATRILIEGGRAVGVRGRIGGAGDQAGRPFTVRARRAVVVAASAIQSPNLLRRSKIRSPALGEGFMAHPGVGVAGLYREPVNAWRGASQGYEAYGLRDTLGVKFESINVPPEVAASRLPGIGKRLAPYLDRLGHLAIWAAALRADAVGTVRPSLLFGALVRYTVLPSDLERLRQGMKALAEMQFAAGASRILPYVFGLPPTLTADQLHLFDSAPLDPRAYSMVATHLFGGCRAGRDSGRSVVDPQLKVHGLDGLYVMDASVFPSNTGVNPQHSIMAVATVAARRLAGE